MKMDLNVNSFAVAIVLLLSYFEIGLLRSIFFPHSIILLGALFISLFIFIANAKVIKINAYEMMWIIAITVLVVFRNQYLSIGENDYNILYYFILCSIIIFTKYQTSWINYFINFLFWISLLHSVVTIMFAINKGLYWQFIHTFMNGDVLQDNILRFNSGTISGLFPNYGANACMISIGTGIAIIRIMIKKKEKLIMNILHIIIRLTALIFTGKRSPIIMMTVALVIIYLIIENRNNVKKVFKVILIGSSLILLFTIVAPLIPELNVLYNRLMNTDDWETLGGRTQLYELASEMIKNNPLFGSGWNSYKLFSENTIGRYYLHQFSRMQAHNIYLQMMSEVGIFGTLIILFLFIFPMKNGFHMCKSYGIDGLKKIMDEEQTFGLIASIFILLFFLLYGFTGNPLYDAYIYFPAFLSCAAIQGLSNIKIKH